VQVAMTADPEGLIRTRSATTPPRGRAFPNVRISPFQCIDETHCCLFGTFPQIIVNDLLDVSNRSVTGNNVLCDHPWMPWRIRLRKASK